MKNSNQFRNSYNSAVGVNPSQSNGVYIAGPQDPNVSQNSLMRAPQGQSN